MVVTIQKQEHLAAIYKFWVETVVETVSENQDGKEREKTP
jgi:hypothetical protein